MMLNAYDYRAAAQRALPRFVYEYLAGGAEDESSLRRNTEDLARIHLLPTCLTDTREVDTGIEVFGQRWQAPFAVAPIGLCGLVRPGGDGMMARAAARAGVPHILSTASNQRLEALHDGPVPALQWMQLYVLSQREIADQIIRRARAAGFGALVLTVDVPVSGARERDARNHFGLPFRPTPRLAADVLRRPGWLWRLARGGAPNFVNMASDGQAGSAQAQAALLSRQMDRSLSWDSLRWLRQGWDGPLLLKGILHPADARRAVQQGVDGLIVSNHGGRQSDLVPSGISALPAVLDAVEGRVPVFVDGGITRGGDVLKARALGATGVLVGRAAAFGLASAGEAGVDAVLALLKQEVERNLVLLGARTVNELGRDRLAIA